MTSDEINSKLNEAFELENKINRCLLIMNNSDERFINKALNKYREMKVENYKARLHLINTELHRLVFGI